MDIRCAANMQVQKDEPVGAIRQFVELLRQCCAQTDNAKVELNLIGVSARAKSTIQESQPDRANSVPFDQALAIAEELIRLTPAKMSGLSFNLSAPGLDWKGPREN